MKSEIEQIQEFTINFFKNLKCKISDGEIIIIENVPKDFEEFFKKKSPYQLAFSEESKTEESILVAKGSSLLNAIRSFLEKSGSTTLLKIDFDVDYKDFVKKYCFKNAEISNVQVKKKNNFFSRFTFLTTFQYLNDKEQILNELYVHNGEIVEGDLHGYEVVEGRKEDVSVEKIEEDCNIAKQNLKLRIEKKTEEVKNFLNQRLEKEISRIQGHYINHSEELKAGLIEELNKLKQAGEKISNEDEKYKLNNKINEVLKKIDSLERGETFEKIEKEKSSAINGETQKHSLNIHNKLINTTIIYYPVYHFEILLKNKFANRVVTIIHNPLTQETNSLFCESCKLQTDDLYLCSSGHISCIKCMNRCMSCSGEFCEPCLKKRCEYCGAKLCNNCGERCFSCGKTFCQNHMKNDSITGRRSCINCLKQCPKCFEYSAPRNFKKDKNGMQICPRCFSKEFGRNVARRIFE
ncbi:MAG: hypothetical protein ACOYT4_00720 [Nanoarchaeota archaeon]